MIKLFIKNKKYMQKTFVYEMVFILQNKKNDIIYYKHCFSSYFKEKKLRKVLIKNIKKYLQLNERLCNMDSEGLYLFVLIY